MSTTLKKPTLQEIRQLLRRELPRLREAYHIDKLGIFGSYAREENSENSDVDLLVTYVQVPGLLKFIALQEELSEVLGVKVDLVMKDSLKAGIRENVLQDLLEI